MGRRKYHTAEEARIARNQQAKERRIRDLRLGKIRKKYKKLTVHEREDKYYKSVREARDKCDAKKRALKTKILALYEKMKATLARRGPCKRAEAGPWDPHLEARRNAVRIRNLKATLRAKKAAVALALRPIVPNATAAVNYVRAMNQGVRAKRRNAARGRGTPSVRGAPARGRGRGTPSVRGAPARGRGRGGGRGRGRGAPAPAPPPIVWGVGPARPQSNIPTNQFPQFDSVAGPNKRKRDDNRPFMNRTLKTGRERRINKRVDGGRFFVHAFQQPLRLPKPVVPARPLNRDDMFR